MFAACAEHGVAVEINSRPERLDPPKRLLRQAVEAGCVFTIDTDAHAPGQLDWLRNGCERAVECEVPAERVLNTWPVEKLLGRHPVGWLISRERPLPAEMCVGGGWRMGLGPSSAAHARRLPPDHPVAGGEVVAGGRVGPAAGAGDRGGEGGLVQQRVQRRLVDGAQRGPGGGAEQVRGRAARRAARRRTCRPRRPCRSP